MFARALVLSLVSSVVGRATALQLDVENQDSIKSTAKSLASSIVAAYSETLSTQSIPGLFDEDIYFFWEAGAVLGSLIDYSRLTGDVQYNDLVSQGMQWQLGEFDAFMPENQTAVSGNDDQSYWGLAALTAAEANLPNPVNGTWAEFAANVFDTQVIRYEIEENSNGTCGGGLRWQIYSFNLGYDYKNTASNANFFLLAARLAKFTGNATYSDWAEKSFAWARDVGLISKEYFVYDGASTSDDCEQINRLQWTQNHASYTEGAAIMYNMTAGNNWSDTVTGLMNSTKNFLDDNLVLVEVACERNGKCDTDHRAYKGIAVNSYARAALLAPSIEDLVDSMLGASAKGAANACEGTGEEVKCKLSWTDVDSEWESASAKDGNLGEVFDALAVVQALLYKNAAPMATSNETTTVGGTNATTSGGSAAPESTSSSSKTAFSFTAILAMMFAAVLNF